jgi:hypothetical protein
VPIDDADGHQKPCGHVVHGTPPPGENVPAGHGDPVLELEPAKQ